MISRIVVLYFVILLLLLGWTYESKNTIKQNKSSDKNDKLINNLKIENADKINKEIKPIRKSKTEKDRLYEEAVKYYGKYYVKNWSKADVIEEYLKEDKVLKKE